MYMLLTLRVGLVSPPPFFGLPGCVLRGGGGLYGREGIRTCTCRSHQEWDRLPGYAFRWTGVNLWAPHAAAAVVCRSTRKVRT